MQTFFYLGNGRGVRPLLGEHYSLVFRRLFVQLWACNVPQCTYKSLVLRRFFKCKLFEAVFVKEFYTNARMLQGRKAFPFKFWILGELESANFGFWVVCAVNPYTNHLGFPLKFTVNLKPNSLEFPAFLELTNSEVRSFIIRATIRTGYIVMPSNFAKWRPHLGTWYVDISRLFSQPWSALFPQYFRNLTFV